MSQTRQGCTTDRRVVAARRIAAHIAEHLQADLSLQLWTGEVLPLGQNARDDIRIVLADPSAVRRLILRPGLMTLFELYATGDLGIEGGSPLQAANRWDHGRAVHLPRRVDKGLIARALWPFLKARPDAAGGGQGFEISGRAGIGARVSRRRDKDYVQYHYDVGNDFYGLFLDAQMVYSCAYFTSPDMALEAAQTEKLDRICRKLRLKPGQRMLDIGSGWGGLAIWAAQNYGVEVHGVTLSREQLRHALLRVESLGLGDRVRLELRDYRDIPEREHFDAVAQVGMFEHVGLANHDQHFDTVVRLLKPRGVYFHQAITRRSGGGPLRETGSTRAIARYIFPGGELDTVGMTVSAMGRAGLEVRDVEGMRDHYELTLRHWSERLHARMAEATDLAGSERARLWLLSFAVFAKAFERGAALLYQTVAQKRSPGLSGLPLERESLKA